MYNGGSINISYQNGDLHVHFKNSSSKNVIGKVKPSCEGYITFGYNEHETFEFNTKDPEISWYGGNARDKWIRGCFCCVIHNLLILFEQEIGVS